MPGNQIGIDTAPGILGIAVLGVTLLFAALAINSLLPRPDWLYNLFHRSKDG